MGYDSTFMINFRKADGSSFKEEEVDSLRKELAELYDEPDEMHSDNESSISIYAGYYDQHWYDHLEDMDKLMSRHPDYICYSHIEGEDHDDTESYEWRKGIRYDTTPYLVSRPVTDGTSCFFAHMEESILIISKVDCKDADKFFEENKDKRLMKIEGADIFGTKMNFKTEIDQ